MDNHVTLRVVPINETTSGISVDTNLNITDDERYLLVDALCTALEFDIDWANPNSFMRFAAAMLVRKTFASSTSIKGPKDGMKEFLQKLRKESSNEG